MFVNDPRFRKGIYYALIFLAIVVIVSNHIHTGWAGDVKAAANELVVYLAGLGGLVAAGNVNKPPGDPRA